MGIKFHCPNGHKLNVKAFLAGKKAVCPKCGMKVVVPEQSEAGLTSSKSPATASAGAPSDGGVAARSGMPIIEVEPAPRGTQPGRDVFSAATAQVVSTAPTSQPQQPVMQPAPVYTAPAPALAPTPAPAPAPAPAPIAAAGVVDAITEAPGAVWYVRPPSGGQFGPAVADVMRGWLAEGRVTADSLVWRAGWPEWRSAAATFPQLVGGMNPAFASVPSPGHVAGVPMGMAAPVGVAPVAATGQPIGAPIAQGGLPLGQPLMPAASEFASVGIPEYDEVSRPRRRRQKGADATMIASGALVALVAILFIILGVVLSRQEPESTEPSRSKPKPATSAPEKKKPAAEKPAAPKPAAPKPEAPKPAMPDKDPHPEL